MAASNAERQAKFRARRKAEAQPIVAKAQEYLSDYISMKSDDDVRFLAVDKSASADVTIEVELTRAALAQACADTIKRFG